MERIQPNKQKKYRRSQEQKGLVRFELQVPAESKARFEEMAEAAADEYASPFDIRKRMAKARAEIFDQITKDIKHEFFTLKDQIASLKEEIKALSPTFFKTNEHDQTPLPESIKTLPNDVEKLKTLLARVYSELQSEKLISFENKRKAEQYYDLYETVNTHNDELQKRLNEN